MEVLAERHRVIGVDLPGQPGLSGPRRPSKSAPYARWLTEVLDALRLEEVRVLAHSMGASVALSAAASGARVGGIAALSPAGIIRLRVSPTVLARSTAWVATRSEGASRALVSMMTTDPTPQPELVEWMTLVAKHVRPGPPPGPLSADVLARVSAQVAIYVGSDDVFLPADRLRRQAERRLPAARIEVVQGAGHLLPQERPEVAEGAVSGLLG